MKKIFISAGDPSGDAHAARLMSELQKLVPDVEFYGIGGVEMQRLGFRSIVSHEEISVVGFWEVAKKYIFFLKLLERCVRLLTEGNFDLFLPVDYPGFNIPLAGRARTTGVPVVYYIAPQLWAWGSHRAAMLADRVDLLLIVFPFEVDFFSEYGITTKFVGHPLLDSEEYARPIDGYDDRKHRLALFPGSRRQELSRHFHLFEDIVSIINKYLKDIEVGLAVSKSIDMHYYKAIAKRNPSWKLFDDPTELMLTSRAGVVKTGTSNLEAVICGLPFAMTYKTSMLTYLLGKKMVNLQHISLANILAGERVVEEFVQQRAKPQGIAEEIIRILTNRLYFNTIQSRFTAIRKGLGLPGASRRAAETIAEFLDNYRCNH